MNIGQGFLGFLNGFLICFYKEIACEYGVYIGNFRVCLNQKMTFTYAINVVYRTNKLIYVIKSPYLYAQTQK